METLPRRGYRFIGKIKAANATPPSKSNLSPSGTNSAQAAEPVHQGIESRTTMVASPGRQRRNLRFVLVLGASLAALLAAVFVRRSIESRAAVRAASIRSIAVLPLENLREIRPGVLYRWDDGRIDYRAGQNQGASSNFQDVGDWRPCLKTIACAMNLWPG